MSNYKVGYFVGSLSTSFEHVGELVAAALGLFMPDECANYVRH